MGRGKGYEVKRQDHEHEKPLTAKRFAEIGEQKPSNMHSKKGGAIKE
ncbi:hypothetical protein N781_17635 [Pontibacillus halophilus JSM 076056 = DSM 19796]|uniref:Uncharacterized protein n=1 Tax=Pontibacillus halophilus JSM 076056 = DSM 19796 TaxID=1385510 RepID=A0A0A5GJU0_9BACI|nr:hypothetical protein [Pontibacillus halophilus]KGX92279.1 hypothetical protein N781_17635 [Pontibacillus halophilus JSM 076056 = DSM 19796]